MERAAAARQLQCEGQRRVEKADRHERADAVVHGASVQKPQRIFGCGEESRRILRRHFHARMAAGHIHRRRDKRGARGQGDACDKIHGREREGGERLCLGCTARQEGLQIAMRHTEIRHHAASHLHIIFVPLSVSCLTGQRSAVQETRKMGQKKKRHGTCRTYPEGHKTHACRAISGEM